MGVSENDALNVVETTPQTPRAVLNTSFSPLESIHTLSPAELKTIYDNLHTFTAQEQEQILEIIEELERRNKVKQAQMHFIEFCKFIDTSYLVATHHKKLAELLEEIAYGHKDRIAVSIPPRHGKSHQISTLFPAWFLGKFPDKRIIMVSHTADLAVDFGRKVRNLIASPAYKEVFPHVSLSQDSKSAGRWNTNMGGEYFACGIGSSIAGRGADLLLVDDPHSEQDMLAGNFDTLEKAYQWFTGGARTRLMSGGRVAIVHTRWHQDDLIGRLVKDGINNEKADQYEVFKFPALLEIKEWMDKEGAITKNEPSTEELQNYELKIKTKALWPQKFDIPTLERTKASMPAFQWNAQYMQNPTAEESAIIKRGWWREWKDLDPPQCDYIIMTLDAAAETNNRADFTALTTWGVFDDEEKTQGVPNIILLNSINVRVEFPELKDLALREYKEWNPDSFIVEKKNAGTQLYQELRRTGISVQEFTPSKTTGDKIVRLNAVADILRSGLVWFPVGRRWAEELIEQCVAFPHGSHDDLVDCVSMALARFRQGGFIALPSDYKDEPVYFKQRRGGYY